LGLASAVSVQGKASYDGWKVYRINVNGKNSELSKAVNKIGLHTWKGKPEASSVVDVVVAPSQFDAFEKVAGQFTVELMHDDLGQSIAAEADFPVYTTSASLADGGVSTQAVPSESWFTAYHSLADHTQFLKDLAGAYPNNAEIFSAGKSNEGRDINGIHIWGSGGKGSKKGIVIHGTVHAREWITTMVAEYTAYQLLTATDADSKSFKDKYDFYILPIVNPDGFAYTQTNNRLWRKNRQSTSKANCPGRDINRNWPSHWSQSGGASSDPCAEDYKGPSAGDGTETKALKAHLDSIAAGKGVQLYMDIHAYSQLWMYPYGYTCSGTVPNAAKYASLTNGAIAAVRAVHGTGFTGGPICSTIYPVTGDSVDYAAEVAKANYSMTVELRDTGANGFVLPAAQIQPSGEEMWAGLSYVFKNM